MGHTKNVYAALLSSDNRFVVSVAEDLVVFVWSRKNEFRNPLVLPWSCSILGLGVNFSPSGRFCATGKTDGRVRLVDLSEETPSVVLLNARLAIHSPCSFSFDERYLLTSSVDRTANLWDCTQASPRPALLKGHLTPITALNSSPDGQHLLTGSRDGAVFLWYYGDGKPRRIGELRHDGDLIGVTFSSQGDLIFIGYKDRFVLWDWASDSKFVTFALTDSYEGLLFSQGSKLIVSEGSDETIDIWDYSRDIKRPLLYHWRTSEFTQKALSSDSRYIAVACDDGTLKLWDCARAEQKCFLSDENPAAPF